ncbi:MAG: hypothetical protein Q8M40_08025 [Legionella sp.]|nr:hypothetical protein [Chlorobiaceae bacterium]MDP3268982.1 hypothetical protein [Legionella sp.]
MPNIGIVDDREAHRTTVAKNVAMCLNQSWGQLNIFPFQAMDDYLSWIHQHDIAVLVLDERLNEDVNGGQSVTYNGNTLASYLRKVLPDFPIFVVTTFADDEDLQESKSEVEGIINRSEFNAEPEVYVPRMVRSGQRFLDQYQNELNQLAELSQKIAVGEASKEDESKLHAIQAKIGISSTRDSNLDKSELIVELSSRLDQFDSIKQRIESLLKEK